MQQFIEAFISGLSLKFYILQVLAILLIFAYGFVFMLAVRGKKCSILDALLSYPIGLITYSIAGYFLLSSGIPFNGITQLLVMAAFLTIVLICFRKNVLDLFGSEWDRKLSIIALIVIILALICTSGIIPVSNTNDSMYFFSEYPRALVYYGNLNAQLDNFLTDASQGIAILGTIPCFMGFDEIFGMQAFFNVNFIALFFYAAFDITKQKLAREKITNAKAFLLSLTAILLLMTSMPFVLMSRWFMANMFFMEYFMIVAYAAYKYSKNTKPADLLVISMLITGISIMRMEGALNAGIIILCIMILPYKNIDVVKYMVCPVLVLQAMFLFRVFEILTLHTDIQFMTKGKAAILLAFLVAIIMYCLIIRNRFFAKLLQYYQWILVAGLLLVNIAVCFYDRADYITNIKAFIANTTRNSGWGLFVSVFIGIIIIVPKKSIKINYFDITAICFILLTIIAAWARGDALYESFGDSGNRVLIQVVPLLVLCIYVKILDALHYISMEK